MNNFEHLLSLSPAELADLFAKTSCVYPDFDNCLVMDCPACVLTAADLPNMKKFTLCRLKNLPKNMLR